MVIWMILTILICGLLSSFIIFIESSPLEGYITPPSIIQEAYTSYSNKQLFANNHPQMTNPQDSSQPQQQQLQLSPTAKQQYKEFFKEFKEKEKVNNSKFFSHYK